MDQLKLQITIIAQGMRDILQKLHSSRIGFSTFSHAIFQIFPANEKRQFEACHVEVVSQWAFDHLLEFCGAYERDMAAKFHRGLSMVPWAGSLRDRLFERQGLLPAIQVDSIVFSRTMSSPVEIGVWKAVGCWECEIGDAEFDKRLSWGEKGLAGWVWSVNRDKDGVVAGGVAEGVGGWCSGGSTKGVTVNQQRLSITCHILIVFRYRRNNRARYAYLFVRSRYNIQLDVQTLDPVILVSFWESNIIPPEPTKPSQNEAQHQPFC